MNTVVTSTANAGEPINTTEVVISHQILISVFPVCLEK